LKLSIITINYNNASGLRKTVESVLSQIFYDFEWIVIDGGSTDDSIKILNKYREHFYYQISEPDNGIYHAMNKGIIKARGVYCLFLNSGDYFVSPYVLKSVFAGPINENIIFGNLIVCLKGKTIGKIRGKKVLTFLDLYNSDVVKHQASFIKRSLFEEFGSYNEDLRIVADWEFFLKTIGLGNVSYRFVNIDIAFFDNNGLSNNSGDITKKERKQVLKNNIPPMMLADYERFSGYLFLEHAFRHKLTVLALRLIAKCAKAYGKIIKKR
jgi:glycosyltransferase involved in cell wall biosynthesis